jgi:hypothetical protein
MKDVAVMENAAVIKARRIANQVGGVGGLALDLLRAGLTNNEALEKLQAAFPEAGTSIICVRWYRSKLRLAGEDVPSSVQARHGEWRPRKLAMAA